MNLSNWLAFAPAARVITSIEFVPLTMDETSDVFSFYQSSNANELAFYDLSPIALEDYVFMRRSFTDFTSQPVKASVPWRQTGRSVFQLEAAPDFVIVCQSHVFLPLSPKWLLGAMPVGSREWPGSFFAMPPEWISMFNDWQTANANRFVFANDRDFSDVEALIAQQPRLRDASKCVDVRPRAVLLS